ncbi:MAG: redoxin domain-containing protein [Solirubrobacteraceae bacterium]
MRRARPRGRLRCGRRDVLGISKDPFSALRRFADKHDLDFGLLSDEDHAVAEAYGTWVEKSMYGRTHMGVQRATFIIGGDGTVAHVLDKASPKTHDDVILKALGELEAAA